MVSWLNTLEADNKSRELLLALKSWSGNVHRRRLQTEKWFYLPYPSNPSPLNEKSKHKLDYENMEIFHLKAVLTVIITDVFYEYTPA